MGNPRDTYVIVTVDTCGIKTDSDGNKINTVKFSDNRGGRPGPGNRFKSKVDSGKEIHWIGIGWCSDPKESVVDVPVAITKISIKEVQSEILYYNEYLDNGTGVVIGAIKRKKNTKDPNPKTEKYTITIRVNGIEYPIDPQLEMI